MVKVSKLTKRFGPKFALQDVSFTINKGEIVGLLGLNGAGKSTLMNIITGYLSPTGGSVMVGGHDVVQEPLAVKTLVGYLPEQPPLYMDMTVEEYLYFVWQLYRKKGNGRQCIHQVMEMAGVAHVCKRMIRNLSKGYRQRVGIAQAILPQPQVLVLDEPSVGLDPTQVMEIRALIREMAQNMTVILSSHIISEVQQVCSRVLVLNSGRLIADDAPENLARHTRGRQCVMLRIQGKKDQIQPVLSAIPSLVRLEFAGEKETGSADFLLEGSDERDIRVDVFEALSAARLPLLYAYGGELSLEEVFFQLLSQTGKEVQHESHIPS